MNKYQEALDRQKNNVKKLRDKEFVEAIEKEIDKTKIHIHTDESRTTAGLIFAYTTFELNLEVKK